MISTDKQTLTCILDLRREGSNVVFYAEAQATQWNRNGDTVNASITSSAPGSNTATAQSADTMTTAGF